MFRTAFSLSAQGAAIPEILEEYLSLKVDLNVLPFTTAIMPDEIVNAPRHGSLCFHPSLLPAYRGGAALSWQIIMGAEETGVSVFKVTEGVDAGPLLVQRGGVAIGPEETMGSLYFDKLYPLGVEAMLDAVAAVADGSAEYREQSEAGASEQGLLNDDVSRIDWSRSASEIERLIRGCDPSPGAKATLDGEMVALFGARLEEGDVSAAPGSVLNIDDGRLVIAGNGGAFSIEKLRRDGAKKVTIGESGISKVAQFS